MSDATGRILIVDDEPALLRMMSTYLARLGFQVTTAETTAKAWEAAKAAPRGFALAVLDASMPGMSTEELALKILDGNPSVRVIAASGYLVDMSSIEGAAPGRVMFLHKPFTPEMLATAVRRMLGPQEEDL